MARETKIGLVSGLTFIICFALILSNRSEEEPPLAHDPYLADRKVVVPQPGRPPVFRSSAGKAADGGGSIRSESGSTRPSRASNLIVNGRTRAHGESRAVAASGAEVVLPGSGAESAGTRSYEVGKRSGTAAAGEGGAESAYRKEPAGRPPAVKSGRVGSVPPGRAVRYTVKPGDTLSRIAAVHYGRRSRAVINAIFDSNRSVLSNPDLLPVNVELILPVIEQSRGTLPGGPDSPGPRSVRRRTGVRRSGGPIFQSVERRTAKAVSGYRWYQIKKNDRYVSIAREQLGDASRWREIYELNRDKFPNPDLIREGVRIKLPVSVVASAQGQRP